MTETIEIHGLTEVISVSGPSTTVEVHGLTPPSAGSTEVTVFVSTQMEVIEVGVTGPQGPPGPQGAAAFVSADSGNTLSLGADTGLFHQGATWSSTNW